MHAALPSCAGVVVQAVGAAGIVEKPFGTAVAIGSAFNSITTIMKTMETTDMSHCIDVCNSLLRGELSAVETYSLAINRHSKEVAATELQRIRSEHALSAARLSQNVRDMGGTPDDDSGAWGIFAKTVQGAANLFGAESAIESLQRGEEKGRSDYEDALKDDEVMASCKEMIRGELLPRVEHHIATLERLENAV